MLAYPDDRRQPGFALRQAKRLLDTDPAGALALAQHAVREMPGSFEARFVLGAAARRTGNAAAARDALAPLAAERPQLWGVQYEYGMALAGSGDRSGAVAALARATVLNPRSSLAWQAFGIQLALLDRQEEALAAAETVLRALPDLAMARAARGATLMRLGREAEAVADYASAVAGAPDATTWLGYGHALRSVGRQADAVAAYRAALALRPDFGEGWWSLANLKTLRLDADDVAQMRAQLARGAVTGEDRAYLDFALGKALEDAADYGPAFEHYARGNAARRAIMPHDADAHRAFVLRSCATFTPAFFAERAGAGDAASDPIFVLGMPRSGSTLVEQILASHSQVEGAGELADITTLARQVAGGREDRYPAGLADVPAAQFASLGAAYLARTRARRPLGRAFFVDKFPGNWLHIGLIQLMLPNARIIDVRRDPRACCTSLFKQSFARGQAYSYDLTDLGRCYTDYATMLAHIDAVLPGRVLHLSYEALVADPERTVRALLEHCGLAFEPGCLTFFETRRAIRTPSSEQVRRPIHRDGLDQWRVFEPWLGDLIDALGPLASDGPDRA